jgi:nitrogen fixation protein FixH
MSVLVARPSRISMVPWLFVAGFALVIAVNGVMMWFAIGSFSGLYSDHARARGLRYNEVVAEQRARDALGWTIEIGWQTGGRQLALIVRDANGRPLSGASVAIDLVRPAEKRAPLGVAMEPQGEGRFVATVNLPALGNWDADIVVEADGRRFAVTKRLFLR